MPNTNRNISATFSSSVITNINSMYGIDVVQKLEDQLVEEISKTINAQILDQLFFDELRLEFQKIRRDRAIDFLTGGEYIDDLGILNGLFEGKDYSEEYKDYIKSSLISFMEGDTENFELP